VIVPPTQPVTVKVAFSVAHTFVLLAEITGAVETEPVPMVIGFETNELPHALTQVAVYVPAPTSFVAPVPKPDDQVIVPSVQPVAVKIAFSVPQTLVLLTEITGAVGARLVPMVIEFETNELPHALTQVAVYVPAPTSFVAPVPKPDDHVIVPPTQPVAVNVAFSVPQILVLLTEITGAVGDGLVPIVIEFETSELPHALTQVAV
jgi:hypothetical protein